MGLAASQARWISLAARKTNVEYEGQQINQARLALSNQSSELWNQLYSMSVPSAPSSTDYTKTQYTFENGDTDYTVTDIQNANYTDEEGVQYNAYVTYNHTVNEMKGVRYNNTSPQVQYVEGDTSYYMVGTKKLTNLNDIATSEFDTYKAQLDQIGTDWPDSDVAKQWAKYNAGDKTALKQIYCYVDGDSETNYVTKDALDKCISDKNASLLSYYADYQKTEEEDSKYAIVEYDSSGRATSMQLQDSSLVYSLNATTTTDDYAYQDAMNKYEYEKQSYEKKVQDINAKTEQIQTEDRTLELRLKQLDTEQSALQTEMETIKKVISKNIDNTFKTFDS